jgi:hypothetical protein
MKKLMIEPGAEVLVDDDVYEWARKYNWHFSKKNHGRWYAKRYRRGIGDRAYLHREVMNFPEGKQVDHINGNTLDNRRENLRIADNFENARNRRIVVNNTSGVTGVRQLTGKDKWNAYVKVKGKRIHLGLFQTKEEAVAARQAGEEKYYSVFRRSYGQAQKNHSA